MDWHPRRVQRELAFTHRIHSRWASIRELVRNAARQSFGISAAEDGYFEPAAGCAGWLPGRRSEFSWFIRLDLLDWPDPVLDRCSGVSKRCGETGPGSRRFVAGTSVIFSSQGSDLFDAGRLDVFASQEIHAGELPLLPLFPLPLVRDLASCRKRERDRALIDAWTV